MERIPSELLENKDFEDKFVRFKIPVKITGCKKVPSIVLDQLQWTGKIGKIGAKSFDVIGMEDKERRELFKDNFLGKWAYSAIQHFCKNC